MLSCYLTILSPVPTSLYQDPPFDIAVKYAFILNQIYNLAFYSGILPQASIWVIVGLIFQYWMDKYQLLRKRTVKQSLSNNLSIEMTEMLEYFMPLFGAAIMYFMWSLRGSITGLETSAFVIGIVHALLPMQELNECLFVVEEGQANAQRYEDVNKNFDTDYKRCNPATRRYATEQLFERFNIENLVIKKQSGEISAQEDEENLEDDFDEHVGSHSHFKSNLNGPSGQLPATKNSLDDQEPVRHDIQHTEKHLMDKSELQLHPEEEKEAVARAVPEQKHKVIDLTQLPTQNQEEHKEDAQQNIRSPNNLTLPLSAINDGSSSNREIIQYQEIKDFGEISPLSEGEEAARITKN